MCEEWGWRRPHQLPCPPPRYWTKAGSSPCPSGTWIYLTWTGARPQLFEIVYKPQKACIILSRLSFQCKGRPHIVSCFSCLHSLSFLFSLLMNEQLEERWFRAHRSVHRTLHFKDGKDSFGQSKSFHLWASVTDARATCFYLCHRCRWV